MRCNRSRRSSVFHRVLRRRRLLPRYFDKCNLQAKTSFRFSIWSSKTKISIQTNNCRIKIMSFVPLIHLIRPFRLKSDKFIEEICLRTIFLLYLTHHFLGFKLKCVCEVYPNIFIFLCSLYYSSLWNVLIHQETSLHKTKFCQKLELQSTRKNLII